MNLKEIIRWLERIVFAEERERDKKPIVFSVAGKIAFACLLLFILMATVTGLILHLNNTASKHHEVTENEAAKQGAVGNLRFSIAQLIMSANDYIITGKEDYLRLFERQRVQVSNYQEKLRAFELTDEERAILDSIAADIDSIYVYANRIFAILAVRSSSKAAALMEIMDYQFGDAVNRKTTKIFDIVFRRIEEHRIHSIQMKEKMMETIYLILFLGLLISLVVTHQSVKKISRPIVVMAKAADSIARGDYSQRPRVKTRDEIALLARSFSQMAEAIDASHRELELQKRFTENIVATIPSGLLVIDRDSQVIFVNRSFCELFNIEVSQVLGKPVDEVLEAVGLSPQGRKIVAARQPLRQLECRCTTITEEQRILNLTLSRIHGEDAEEKELLIVSDITALRQVEARYQQLFDNVPVGLYRTTPAGEFIDANPALIEMLGYPNREALMAINSAELYVNPKDRIRWQALIERESVVQDFEVKFRRPDGKLLWVQNRARIVKDERGQVKYYEGSIVDITERKQAEEALRASEHFRRLIIDNEPECVKVVGQDGNLIEMNPAGLKMIEADSLEDVKGKPVLQLIAPKYRTAFKNLHREVMKGKSVCLEFEIIGLRGTHRWVETHAVPFRDEWNKIVALLSITRDITDRKIAEAERERLLTAIEQAGESILITDTAGCIQYVNPAFERLTGYTREEVIGQSPRILNSGKHDKTFYRELWETISAGKVWQGRIVNKRKDGSLYISEQTISPVYDPDGRIINYVAVERDITEQLRLEEQLQQAQRMESVGRLAGGVAHDFNNMLTAILGYANLALMKLDPSHPLRPFCEQVREAGQRAANLTQQLLAFARKQTVAPQVLDLNETISTSLKMLRRLIGEDIDLDWIPGTHLWSVKMDPAQVDQILTNLCVNARDAISGVGKIIIETENVVLDEAYCATHRGFVPGEYVQLVVSDTGSGMDKQIVEKIFEPFFTTKEPGKGTGLGLATVYGIVKQNNGFINVYSEPGKGTTFKIYLPKCSRKTPKNQEEKQVSIPKGHGETILLVEDEESILSLGRTMLEGLGYKVLTAASPLEAIRLAKSHAGEIRLLITDVIMPEMNGRELSEKLQTLQPHIKCLYMSGYTANAISHRGVLAEGVHFIQKPFSLENLAFKVREVLDEKNAKRKK